MRDLTTAAAPSRRIMRLDRGGVPLTWTAATIAAHTLLLACLTEA
jgi:hypothetical protein